MQQEITISNNYPEGYPGYNLYVFDIRHHQDYSSGQPFKVRFDFRSAVPAATNLMGHAVLLQHKLVSVSIDGQRRFDSV